MNENEYTQPAGAGGMEAQPASAKTGGVTHRRRRRPGNRRRHTPAGAPAAGTEAASEISAETATGEERPASAETANERPEADAAETGEASETEIQNTAADAEESSAAAAGEGGPAKRRRRRRGGRRHRRRSATSGAAAGGAGLEEQPSSSEPVAAEKAGEAREQTAAEEREAVASIAETYVPSKPKEDRRLPAPAPEAAPADKDIYVDIAKLAVRQESDAYRVMKFPGLDAGRAKRLLIQFLQEQREKTGLKKAVLGLSGGLDSSVSAALAVDALGAENVLLYLVTDGHNQAERERAGLIAGRLRRSLEIRDIQPQINAFFSGQPQISPQRRRQLTIWELMAVLYDQAAAHSAMVITTCNKTKRLLGYGSDFGQNGYSVNLLGDLYQSQVRELARVLNLPGPVLDPNITSLALSELGLTLQEADGFLYQIVDVRVSLARLLDLGVEEEKLRRIYRRIKDSAFRRALAPTAESQAVYVPRGWNAGAR